MNRPDRIGFLVVVGAGLLVGAAVMATTAYVQASPSFVVSSDDGPPIPTRSPGIECDSAVTEVLRSRPTTDGTLPPGSRDPHECVDSAVGRLSGAAVMAALGVGAWILARRDHGPASPL